MKLLSWILIVLSLVLAITSAVTAYIPKTALSDQRLRAGDGEPLTLAAPAGSQLTEGQRRPLAQAGEKLTPQLLERLRADGQTRVRVKEFSLNRWSESWIFMLGCAGMFAGALLIRRQDARQLATGVGSSAGAGGGAESELGVLRADLAQLRRAVTNASNTSSRLELIVAGAERLSADHVPPFLAARPQLVARLGLAGYAQLMDRFAAGERKLHRAWSAAADGYEHEALVCLDNASLLFDEAEQRMK